MSHDVKDLIDQLLKEIKCDEEVLDELEERLDKIGEEAERLERNLDDPKRVLELKAEMMRLRYEFDEFKRRRKERLN